MKKGLVTFVAAMVAMSGACFCGNATTAEAMQLSSAEHLADKFVSVSRSVETDGSETTVYRNVAEYKNTLARNYRLSEEARAKLLYKSMGVPEDQIDAMEKDKLLEVFDYTECTQTTNYIATINGENENISRAQMVNALSRSDDLTLEGGTLLEENVALIQDEPVALNSNIEENVSEDGYMKMTTWTSKTTGPLAERTYYTVSVYNEWLKIPVTKWKDVLVIKTDNATHDETYIESGYYECMWLETTSTGAYVDRYGIRNDIRKGQPAHSSYYNCDTDNLSLDYSAGLGCVALRVYLEIIGNSNIKGHNYQVTMCSSLTTRYSLYNTDAHVQGVYGHKKSSWGSDISVSITVGGVLSLDANWFGVSEYYGNSMSIYY